MELWTVIHNAAYMYAQYIHAYQALCGKANNTYSNVIFTSTLFVLGSLVLE